MKILLSISLFTGLSIVSLFADIQETKSEDDAKSLSYYREATTAVPRAPSTGPRVIAPRATRPAVPRTPAAPSASASSRHSFPWKKQITATIFWIGEKPTQNNPTPNHMSSWDQEWKINYGGYDDPNPAMRVNYRPKDFYPKENPFYIALPYNDVAAWNQTKPEAKRVIPWYEDRFSRPGKTVLKGQWVAIRFGNKTCYAQWEDCGPFHTDDWAYVFGNARPKNTSKNGGAGIDISPSVRDYLEIKSGQACDWRFVDASEVPTGPWKHFGGGGSGSGGGGGHYVNVNLNAKAKPVTSEEIVKLREQRDEWVRRQSARRGATVIRAR